MTDFPTLFIILACIFLIGLIPLALCALYAACQKRKWCSAICLWDQRENGNMATSVDLDDLASARLQQPPSRPVSALLGDASQRSSHCEASDTASDPGMDHINRFLGRSLSDGTGNIYESESDAGVLHIRRALGLMNKGDVDPGIAHVRRALGMVHDVRGAHGQIPNQPTVSSSQSDTGDLASNRTITDSPQTAGSENRGRNSNGNAAACADTPDTSPTSDTYSDGSHVATESGPHPNTIDRLPSYEEALDILAKINEPEEPPPSYDDAVGSRGSRSTEV